MNSAPEPALNYRIQTRLNRIKQTNIRLKVTGHAGPSDETATYFEGYPVGQMLEEVISKVSFHEDLGLIDHLKDSKWAAK